MSAARYWTIFSLGVIAGAAVALIYAPQTGEKTRKQLKRNFNDASDYLKDASEYLKDASDDLSKQAKRAIKKSKDLVDKSKDLVDEVSAKIGSAASTVSDKISDLT